ncbi:hypothetical protein J1605_002072 [Eschrichtius robustus]|uniref:Uncharacterized protein n=1 Tax=Eschrichtius robustus TaxID=9764 RepID=A0AB34HVD4_ESCRO|nr:hypothetical protein J1605_002072 [Eschrichtius robustus]
MPKGNVLGGDVWKQPGEPLDGSSGYPLATGMRTAPVETAQPGLGRMEPDILDFLVDRRLPTVSPGALATERESSGDAKPSGPQRVVTPVCPQPTSSSTVTAFSDSWWWLLPPEKPHDEGPPKLEKMCDQPKCNPSCPPKCNPCCPPKPPCYIQPTCCCLEPKPERTCLNKETDPTAPQTQNNNSLSQQQSQSPKLEPKSGPPEAEAAKQVDCHKQVDGAMPTTW